VDGSSTISYVLVRNGGSDPPSICSAAPGSRRGGVGVGLSAWWVIGGAGSWLGLVGWGLGWVGGGREFLGRAEFSRRLGCGCGRREMRERDEGGAETGFGSQCAAVVWVR
jgi:hypothetical protein